MASVATFWWTPEDERDFFSFLESTGPAIAYTAPWKRVAEDVIGSSPGELIAQEGPARILLGLRARPDLEKIVARDFPPRGVLYNVDSSAGCVLTYDMVGIRGSKLARCNLSAYWSYLDVESRAMIHKDAEFVRWGKRVFAWVRAQTKEKSGHYGISERAKSAAEKGDIILGEY